jgi:hypothetical protein
MEIKVKQPYKKPEAVKELEEMANRVARDKFPGTPAHLLAPRKYRDDNANALTKCIVDYVKFNGGFATRLSSTGTYRADLRRFVFSNQIKGMPDIQGVIRGRPLYVEVKIDRDRLSAAQIQIKNKLEASGGLYFVATCFQDFKAWFDKVNNGRG